jgi:hypothetical protein
MPKDNRNTLAAFDDLLASLEGLVDDDNTKDTHDPEPSSAVDNEFYDFYFEINNVPRRASNAATTPVSKRSSIPPPNNNEQVTSPHPPPPPPPARNPPPEVPVYKPQIGSKPKPAAHKSQLKSPPSKPNSSVNKSSLSLKKPGIKPKGSNLRVIPPSGSPAPPYEAPQRFLSRGSYGTGASQVEPAAPPPPKEIPQKFMSTGSFITPTPPAPQPPQPSPTSSNPPADPAPQRFYSTNNFSSRPQPSSPSTRDTQRPFMSTNAYAPNRSGYNDDMPRNSYIGNRPSRNSQSFSTPQSYSPAPPPSYSPAPSYNSAPSYNPTPYSPQASNNSQLSYNSQSSYNPPQAHNPPPRPYYPPDNTSDYDRRSNKLASVNNRKSVRMPQSNSPNAANNFCAKCGMSIKGEQVMALNKFWCVDHFTCRDCGTPVIGVFSEENGHPYCSDCMARKYACVTCGRGVTSGQFYQTEHGRRHAECMPTTLCDICNNPIKAGTPKMSALDKTYHPECFCCTVCSRQIQGEFTNRSGRPVCMQCSHSTQPKCAKCYNSITGQYVAYSSARYHHECFCCERCNVRLSLDAFYTSGDRNFCEKCINLVVQ